MNFKIAVLPGDGIGPEISAQGVDVMSAVCERFGHDVEYGYALCGADAIDRTGDPFPEETFRTCLWADAVLFSAVGDPRFDNDPTAKVRPEQGLLAMRKKLGLFANIRPVETFDCLIHMSPLRKEIIEGADFVCIRELTGGMYFGEKFESDDRAYDTNAYTRAEIERILRVAYAYAGLPPLAKSGSGDGSAISRHHDRLHVCRQCRHAYDPGPTLLRRDSDRKHLR